MQNFSARALQRAVNVLICVTQVGGLSIYVLFTATSLHQLHGQYNIYIYILVLFLPVTLLALIRSRFKRRMKTFFFLIFKASDLKIHFKKVAVRKLLQSESKLKYLETEKKITFPTTV